MNEEKQRFSALIDKELDAAKSNEGAYAKLYEQQKGQWIGPRRDQILKSTELSSDDKIAQIQQLDSQFDAEWDKNKDITNQKSLKFSVMKSYDGESKETQVENAANTAMDKAGSVIGGGVSSMLMGGDFAGGISHSFRHMIMGLIMSIPFVGEFLGQAMGWTGSQVKSLFGGEEKALSWSEAGEKVGRDKIKERIGADIQNADPNRLAALVDEAAKKPGSADAVKGRAMLDKDKDDSIKATELDMDSNGMLTTADKEQISKQLNDSVEARKLFDELKGQGVTFDNQQVKELTSQSVPSVLPAGNSQSK